VLRAGEHEVISHEGFGLGAILILERLHERPDHLDPARIRHAVMLDRRPPHRYPTNADRRRPRRNTDTVATAATPARAAKTNRVSPSGRTTLCPRSACQVTSSTTAV